MTSPDSRSDSTDRPQPGLAREWVKMSQAGSLLIGPSVLGVLLDWQLATLPWLTVIGVIVGLVSVLGFLLRVTQLSQDATSSSNNAG